MKTKNNKKVGRMAEEEKMNIIIGISLVVIGLVEIIFLLGWKKIPTDPPTFGVVTFLGRRTGSYRKEGWTWLIPILQGLVLVDMRKKNLDFTPEDVRTLEPQGGRAEVEISVAITYTPDKKRLVEFLDAGRSDGVLNIIDDMVAQAVREFASGKPWSEVVGAHEEMGNELAKKIVGEDLPEAEIREMAKKLRRGNSAEPIPNLGIILNRLNVGPIKVLGELAKAAEQRAKQEQERAGEVYETETDLIKAQKIVEAAKSVGKEINIEDAFKIIMDYKTAREGRGFVIPGLHLDLNEAIEAIPAIVAILKGGKNG